MGGVEVGGEVEWEVGGEGRGRGGRGRGGRGKSGRGGGREVMKVTGRAAAA